MLKQVLGIAKQPVFALMITYDTAEQPFDAAQVVNSPVLKLITCNSAKPGQPSAIQLLCLHNVHDSLQAVNTHPGGMLSHQSQLAPSPLIFACHAMLQSAASRGACKPPQTAASSP